MIGCQFCTNVFIIVNKVPTNCWHCCVDTLNFVAVVTNVTSRRQVFSTALPGLTAKSNTITCWNQYTPNLIFLKKHDQWIRDNPFQVSQTITKVIPVTKLCYFTGWESPGVWVVRRLERPAPTWQQWRSSGLCSINLPQGDGEGQSFGLSSRIWDYTGERGQKGLGKKMARLLAFCPTERSHLMCLGGILARLVHWFSYCCNGPEKIDRYQKKKRLAFMKTSFCCQTICTPCVHINST